MGLYVATGHREVAQPERCRVPANFAYKSRLRSYPENLILTLSISASNNFTEHSVNFPAQTVLRRAALAVFSMAMCSVTASAQTKPAPSKPMEMDKMEMHESASGWKELDAFHELMAASWHPASGKNDLAPAKAKATDMAKAAKVWADSKAPKSCDTPAIKESVTKVNAASQEYAGIVAKGADDATIKAKLKAIHETFETAEMGCHPAK